VDRIVVCDSVAQTASELCIKSCIMIYHQNDFNALRIDNWIGSSFNPCWKENFGNCPLQKVWLPNHAFLMFSGLTLVLYVVSCLVPAGISSKHGSPQCSPDE
jgi:hypothetical protein